MLSISICFTDMTKGSKRLFGSDWRGSRASGAVYIWVQRAERQIEGGE